MTTPAVLAVMQGAARHLIVCYPRATPTELAKTLHERMSSHWHRDPRAPTFEECERAILVETAFLLANDIPGVKS